MGRIVADGIQPKLINVYQLLPNKHSYTQVDNQTAIYVVMSLKGLLDDFKYLGASFDDALAYMECTH